MVGAEMHIQALDPGGDGNDMLCMQGSKDWGFLMQGRGIVGGRSISDDEWDGKGKVGETKRY